jgi:hypothetical protein
MKHRLKGFYISGILYWIPVLDGFKYLGCVSTISEGIADLKEAKEMELDNIRRSLEW